MANATGANTKVYYSAETVIGTTDPNPEFKELPYSGSTLEASIEAIEDERLGGRDVKCHTQGNMSVAGDVNSFLSYGDYDDLLAAAFCGSWEADTPLTGTDELKNGIERKGFTFVHEYNDFSPVGYEYFTGCEVNTLNIEMTPGQNVAVTFGIVGQDSPGDEFTKITGSTYVASSSECPFAGFRATIEIDGQMVAEATQLSTTIENGIEGSYVLGSKTVASNKSIGKFRATGSLTVQFVDYTLYQKYRRNESFDMVYSFENKDGSTLTIRQPNTKITSASRPISGDGEIILSGDLKMLKDETEGATLIAQRTTA